MTAGGRRRRAALALVVATVIAAVVVAAATVGALPRRPGPLGPCVLLAVRELGRCGAVTVYEDRARAAGRTIRLRVVVLRARDAPAAPDPVVLLTGGPGLGAADGAAYAARVLAATRRHRDIVLVDQRGTGRSHPLACDLYGDRGRLQPYLDPWFPPARVRACRAALLPDADVVHYTTAAAVDDLADVLTALGVARANLFGVSYGSRVALAFLRRHPGRVRSVAVQGVVPPEQTIPLAAAWAGDRVLAARAAECVADAACRARAPDPAGGVRRALARLHAAPARLTVWNWRRLRRERVVITERGFAERAWAMLYGGGGARGLFADAHRAAAGDWTPFAASAVRASRRRKHGRSWGMMLSVLCTEDAPRLARADTAGLAAAGALGLPLVQEVTAACALWPRGALAPADTLPVTSRAPVLLLSGALDPVTPPEWADAAARRLPNSLHVVVPGAGHADPDACTAALLGRFVSAADVRWLTGPCLHGAAFGRPTSGAAGGAPLVAGASRP